MVLVKRNLNSSKKDKYPIPQDLRRPALWASWKDAGLISQTKFNRLMRQTPFSDEEKAGFIARQLVETRQGTKFLTEMLRTLDKFKNSKIVFVKANQVSDFRKDYDILKVRELNDLHHAKDAYINILVGNVHNLVFSDNPFQYVKKKELFNLKYLFKGPKYILDENGEIQKDADGHYLKEIKEGKQVMIPKIRYAYAEDKKQVWNEKISENILKQVARNDILITRMVHVVKGGFYDQNPKGKGKRLPVKHNSALENVGRYGGYNSPKAAGLTIINKKLVPVLIKDISGKKQVFGQWTLFELGGFRFFITGFQDGYFCSPAQLILNNDDEAYLKMVMKKVTDPNNIWTKSITKEKNIEFYDKTIQIMKLQSYQKDPFIKTVNEKLDEKKEQFENLEIIEQCKALSNIIRCFTITSSNHGPTVFGSSEITSGKNIKKEYKNPNLKIILQSPTGLFEEEVKLFQ
jgi:CRISPR-associated endonuclease Csn1